MPLRKDLTTYYKMLEILKDQIKDCKLIYSEGYTYTFMKNKIKTGILWYCD